MPALNNIKSSKKYKELKKSLERSPGTGLDMIYNPNEEVNFTDACSQTNQGKGEWVGVTVTCHNFAIGEETGGSGSLGNDDPQYVGICACPSPTITRSSEYTDTPERVTRWVNRRFGAYSPLNQTDPVRFGVITNAFNNDSSEAWEGIVDALSGDLSTATTLGINAVPGLAQFATVGAIGEAISKLVKDALTNEPDDVGSVDICDTINPIKWYAKTDKQTWTARKWAIHTIESEIDSGWYLSQWFITLSKRIARYETSQIDTSQLYSSLEKSGFELSNKEVLAGLYAIRGGNIDEIAEKFGLKPTDVLSTKFAMSSASNEELAAMINAAIIEKLG